MRFLADTHALIWAVGTPEFLSRPARNAFETGELIVSVASLWELSLKARRKDAPFSDPLGWWDKYVTKPGVEVLPIRVADVVVLDSLPEIHKDPFDRILVAQAFSEDIPLVTKDGKLRRYGVSVIW